MKRAMIIAVALVALLAAGCGREVVSSDREVGGGTTGGTTGETTSSTTEETAGSAGTAASSTQGVVDSYTVAQQEIEAEGGEKEVGEYRVGYIVEPAEGWWRGDPGDLRWREPSSGETCHLEILPFDAETGLLVPGMEGTLTVLDQSGRKVASRPLEFYYAEFYHYANNFALPESGTYTLRAELRPPDFRRHGDASGKGKKFTKPLTVEFENVEIEAGK